MKSFLILWALPVVHDLFLISFISLTNLVIYLLTILSTQFWALGCKKCVLLIFVFLVPIHLINVYWMNEWENKEKKWTENIGGDE